VCTPVVTTETARVEVLTRVQNGGDTPRDCVLATTIVDAAGAVELFLNDRSFGEQVLSFPRYGMDPSKGWGEQDWMSFVRPTTADLHARWTVPYAPGVLRAVGRRDGEIACRHEIATAGPAAQLDLTADRQAIAAGGRDVVHLVVQVRDAQGIPVPTADDLISFELRGPGRIIGVDNGNPVNHEPFRASQRRAFNGLCLAIVQSTNAPGTVEVTARAAGLEPASVSVRVDGLAT
jgi:beta-galactosidase